MKRPKDKLVAGIDLHSNNLMIGLVNQKGQRVAHRKLDCDLQQVVEFLEPYQKQLESMAVESTFNWYWLVDGLRKLGYPIDLANPARIEQYSGLKHADDLDDAYHLAELQRLKILPKAHVYDPVLRPMRDLFRRRTSLVPQRTSLFLSFKSLFARTTGQALDLKDVKKMEPKQAPTTNAKATTTKSAATNIWRGPLWRRPTSRGASMGTAASGMIARRPGPVPCWLPKRWDASWPKRPGT